MIELNFVDVGHSLAPLLIWYKDHDLPYCSFAMIIIYDYRLLRVPKYPGPHLLNLLRLGYG